MNELSPGPMSDPGMRGDAIGWFRRAPIPYFEILRLEGLDTGRARTCYSSYANFGLGALVLLAGLYLLTS
jgi:hypothetical protein